MSENEPRWYINIAILDGVVVDIAHHSASADMLTSAGNGIAWATFWGPMTWDEAQELLPEARRRVMGAKS
jgi:hypothetical protein